MNSPLVLESDIRWDILGGGFLAVKRRNKDFGVWEHKAQGCCNHLITMKTVADSLRKAKVKNEKTCVHMTLVRHWIIQSWNNRPTSRASVMWDKKCFSVFKSLLIVSYIFFKKIYHQVQGNCFRLLMISNWILGTDKRVPREAREAKKSLKLNKIFVGPLSLKPNYPAT